MSRITKEINKITGTIIGISGKLILYAVITLLLFEGITRGYAFGHDIFYATAMEEAPGTPKTVTIPKGYTTAEACEVLKAAGLIDNVLAFQIQKMFYDYEIHPGTYELNTSMTSKAILQELNVEPEAESGEALEDGADGPAAAGERSLTDDEALDVLLDAYGRNAGESRTEPEGESDQAFEPEIEIEPEGAAE